MNGIRILLMTISFVSFFSCGNDITDANLELGNGKDVIVLLEVLDNEGIEKIEFQSNGGIEIASAEDIKEYKSISYRFNGKGEGTFKICVFSESDTICSEHYVEGGYRPKLKCTAKQIDVDDHIGIGY